MKVIVLSDGAPNAEAINRPDLDALVRENALSEIRRLTRAGAFVGVLWEYNENFNGQDVDRLFFERASDECGAFCQKLPTIEEIKDVAVQIFTGSARTMSYEYSADRIPPAYNTELRFPFQMTPEMIRLADSLCRETPLASAEALVRWALRNLKYKYEPFAPYKDSTTVFRLGYGVCGELANLVVAFLRYWGIPSCVLLVDRFYETSVLHASAGFVVGGRRYNIDLSAGSMTASGVKSPISDNAWISIVKYWVDEPAYKPGGTNSDDEGVEINIEIKSN